MKIKVLLFSLLLVGLANAQEYSNINQVNYTWQTKIPKFNYQSNVLPPPYALLESLSNFHKGEQAKYINFLYYNDSINVTKEVKNKILSILKNEWTLEELSHCWKIFSNVSAALDRKRIQYLAAIKRSSNKSISIDSATCFIHDSLAAPYKMKFEESIRNFKIPQQMLYIAAWANIKEAIPILKRAQINNAPNFNQFDIILALARLGDKEALNLIYDSVKSYNNNNQYYNPYVKDIFFPLMFINSQESIYNFIHLIDTTKKSKLLYNDEGYINVYSSTTTVTRLFHILKNQDFHQIFKDFSIIDPYIGGEKQVNATLLIRVKEWLIKNKGKYILNFNAMFSNIINTLER